MTIVEKADLFASVAHGAIGQKRKYSHDDYIVHPRRVAKTVTDIGGTDDMIAAALLHDVIEDTAITGPMIMEAFGASIFKLAAVQPAGLFEAGVLALLLSLPISLASHGLTASTISPAVLPLVVPVLDNAVSCALALSTVNLI